MPKQLDSAAVCLLVVLALLGPAQSGAQEPPVSAEARAVFERSRAQLVQLRVVHRATRAETMTGSGFVAAADGAVVTNYHVVSKIALEPDAYELELVWSDGSKAAGELRAIDVANDLGIVASGRAAPSFLALRTAPLAKGDRGFAMGHPLDLGLTIVEGTYNGIVEHDPQGWIHFSGAINAGMSGGPALARDGKVFGVNVAHRRDGQLVSFLVPVRHAARLLESVRAGGATPADFRKEVAAQLVAHQAAFAERLLAAPFPVSRFGPYGVPDAPDAFTRCAGGTPVDPNRLYEVDSKACGYDRSVYVDDTLHTGGMRFNHRVYRHGSLGPVRFASLLEHQFEQLRSESAGSARHFTAFQCHDGFVAAAGGAGTLRVALCTRAYRLFPGLYDFRLRLVAVDSSEHALVSVAAVSGVSFDNGMRFARRFLEAIR